VVLTLKDRLTLKNASRNGEVSLKNRNCLMRVHLETGQLTDRIAYSCVKVQSHFYPGDLVTCTGDREIRSVSRRVGM